MDLLSHDHYDLMAQFEKTFFSKHKPAREAKEFWPMGAVYCDGHINNQFLAYQHGYAYGLVMGRDGQ